jgi:hypothetical protein
MQYLIVLTASAILLALILMGLGLKSLLNRNKNNNITSCGLNSIDEPGCGCSNVENCYHKKV